MSNGNKDFEFKNLSKVEALNKENQILLNRLLEISTSNPRSVVRKKKHSEFRVDNTLRKKDNNQREIRPRSLNLHFRILEDQKIREENIRMAQRLFDK
mmetsp:Transcript_10300/g.11537  ORF Transcript_10300/g.11537 Transcript_10300/m.11537 type:complete len:98 (+) Transcript_10300:198-491(+)